MINSLPDVNVWLALAAEGHVHHRTAREWFLAQQDASVAFCRVTQMGFLRLLTNPAAMRSGPRTIADAWDVYEQIRRNRRVVFLGDPEGVQVLWQQFMRQSGVGPSAWTDGYLAALAQYSSCSLITFDGGFARWQTLAHQRL